MNRRDVPIHTPCGADWSAMSPTEARARLCGACDKVVHDLSGRSKDEVRELLSDGPVCVRYLYDVHGRILVGGAPAGATVVPASALLSKAAKSKWLKAAALAATAIVFEACGGNRGADVRGGYYEQMRGAPAVPYGMPGADAGDAPATTTVDAGADADAGPQH